MEIFFLRFFQLLGQTLARLTIEAALEYIVH